MNALQKIPDWFYGTSVGKKMQQEQQRKIAGERKEHIAAIEVARSLSAAKLPALEKAVKKAEADFKAAHDALKATETGVVRAKGAYGRVVNQAEGLIRQHQQALAETADPRIPEMVAELRELHWRERRQRYAVKLEETGEYGVLSGQPFVRVFTNAQARADRLKAILTAITAAEGLRYSPNTNVAEEFEAILTNLPTGEEMQLAGVKEKQQGDRDHDPSDRPRPWVHKWKDDPELVGSR